MSRKAGSAHIVDKTGQVFGEWTVLSRLPCSVWLCRCSCGKEQSVTGSALILGTSTKCRSCGTKTHGKSRTKIHGIWTSMLARCTNPKHVAYNRYGGRGIEVCERWRTFANFYADMGEPPEGKTIDRIDNDGDYTPENTRWTDLKTQNRNRSSNSLHTVNGITKTIAEWAEEKGMPPRQLRLRMKTKGLTMEQALALPYKPYKT